jgi:4-amino-4-deoxy-L-arabinose transferase-like glycosyltransferase
VSLARVRDTGRARWALAAGAALGVLSLIRPLEAFVVSGLLGMWALTMRGRRFRFAPVVALIASAVAVGSLNLPYNRELTGSARVFPIMAYTDRYYGPGSNALGFGPDRGVAWPTSGMDAFPGHGVRDAIVNSSLNLFSINVELLGWSTGSALILAMLVFGPRKRRADWAMVAAIVMVAGIHCFYWFSGGPDFGARYWYLVIVPCMALAARGIAMLERHAEGADPPSGTRVLGGVGILILSTLLSFFPWRAADKYYRYRGMRPDVRALARQHDFGRSLVLVRGRRHPDYASAAIYNPIDLRADATIFAWERNADVRSRLLAAYRDRPVWVLNGPTITRRGYEVVAGPLTTDSAARLPEYVAPPVITPPIRATRTR